MFRSVFLRRIIFMMVISLLASAVVTSAMFYFFSFRALRTDRETEMQTRAGSIAKVYGDSLASDSQDELLPDVLTNVAINDSYAYCVFNRRGVKRANFACLVKYCRR